MISILPAITGEKEILWEISLGLTRNIFLFLFILRGVTSYQQVVKILASNPCSDCSNRKQMLMKIMTGGPFFMIFT